MAEYPELRGKVVVVTGGAAGIGGAASAQFARQGATVAILDRDGQAAHDLAVSLTTEGLHAQAFRADVTSRTEV